MSQSSLENNAEPSRQILHVNPNAKHRQISSSLLLTSTLLNHKQKLLKSRPEKPFAPNLQGEAGQGFIKANRLSLKENLGNREGEEKMFSNI